MKELAQNKLKRTGINDHIFNLCNMLLMAFITIAGAYPFIYMLILSLSSGNTYAKVLIYPVGFSFEAYVSMVKNVDFFGGLKISMARSLLGPICTIFVIFMGAYSLSRTDLVFRKALSRYVVFSMYFTAGILPVYINMSQLNLTGSFLVYIVPLLVNVFELILIRTFIENLPKTLEDSAFVDGANDLQIAFRIIFPLCAPVLAAVILFEFINQWNSYTDTLLYNTSKSELFTLQYILTNYLKQDSMQSAASMLNKGLTQKFTVESLKMAMTVIACIPIIIIYPFLQKYFIKGLLIGSIKG